MWVLPFLSFSYYCKPLIPQLATRPDHRSCFSLRTVQFCLHLNNHSILWLPRFRFARDYPIQKTCFLSHLRHDRIPPSPSVYTSLTTIVRTRSNPSLWAEHIGRAIRQQRCSDAARLVDYSSCVHPSAEYFWLGGQHSVSHAQCQCCGEQPTIPMFTCIFQFWLPASAPKVLFAKSLQIELMRRSSLESDVSWCSAYIWSFSIKISENHRFSQTFILVCQIGQQIAASGNFSSQRFNRQWIQRV